MHEKVSESVCGLSFVKGNLGLKGNPVFLLVSSPLLDPLTPFPSLRWSKDNPLRELTANLSVSFQIKPCLWDLDRRLSLTL